MTEFIQLVIQGVALGFTYALLALSFAIIYRASNVLNFGQGAMLLLGAYLVSWMTVGVGLPFAISALLACAILAIGGVVFQRAVLQRIAGAEEFVPIMVTLGAGIVITAGVEIVFGSDQRQLGDPWGSSSLHVGDYVINWVKLWTIAVAVLALLGYFAFDRLTRYGLAIRAAASDEEGVFTRLSGQWPEYLPCWVASSSPVFQTRHNHNSAMPHCGPSQPSSSAGSEAQAVPSSVEFP
jgi:branched-chain amino acid transport system permease protein